jgi:hypothetical protein
MVCHCGHSATVDGCYLTKLIRCNPLAEVTQRAPLMLDPDEFSDYDGEDDE